MTRTKETWSVQWGWRLLLSGLLCVPAIFMLVAGDWSAVTPLQLPDSSEVQPYSSSAVDLTISLPKTALFPDRIVTTPDTWELASNAALTAEASQPPPQRYRSQPARLGLWYAGTPRQERPPSLPLRWTPTRQPAVWVPGANQDGGG